MPEPDLVARVATLMLANGQTTEGTALAVARLGSALGGPRRLQVRWGQVTLYGVGGASLHEVEPSGVDIARVVAAEAAVDDLCAGRLRPEAALALLDEIGSRPPVSLARFVPMAAAGAAALSIIFGATNLLTIGLIGTVAGLGALLRRAVAGWTGSPLAQPFAAALLAGFAAGLILHGGWTASARLLVACPCMVLVPGPHFLNGAIDLVRARLPIGAARLLLAGLIVLAICVGLLGGLAVTGSAFPPGQGGARVPLAVDVLAAGVAVAAYASFFHMPWRLLPVPLLAGMAAHALRWSMLDRGADPALATLAAALVAGSVVGLASHHTRVPFGAAAFAAVVSMIPGVYLFEAASGLTTLQAGGGTSSWVQTVFAPLSTAALILLAMGGGLIAPKLVIDAVAGQFGTREGDG